MPWVEMMIEVTGGRADGTNWPLPGFGDGSKLFVSDLEGQELTSRGMAKYCEAPARSAPKEERAVVPDDSAHATAPPETAAAAGAETAADEDKPKVTPGRERQAAATRSRAGKAT